MGGGSLDDRFRLLRTAGVTKEDKLVLLTAGGEGGDGGRVEKRNVSWKSGGGECVRLGEPRGRDQSGVRLTGGDKRPSSSSPAWWEGGLFLLCKKRGLSCCALGVPPGVNKRL